MKIVSAETMVVEIPFQLRGTGVGIMPTAWKSLEFALVRLEDERGNVGWGEGFGYFTVDATKAIMDQLILPTLIGTTIEDIPAWNLQTQRRIHMFGRYGVTMFAIGGVDLALWDLKGKREGVSVSKLLGNGQRTSIPFYCSPVRYADPKLAAMTCEEAMKAGFSDIKLHEIALKEIAACREVLGDTRAMCVDVNCAWTKDFIDANRAELEELNLSWLEEPIFPPEDFEALAERRSSSFPIAAGENWCTTQQFRSALSAGAVDIVQPSVTKVGGISEFAAVLDVASQFDASVMPHSPYFGPGFFASLQLAAAFDSVKALEWNFVQPDAWLADVEGIRRGDVVNVPQGPGLGFEPDMDVLKRYRRA
ncbi:mandelate racemase/muconate lactonizing enzyme family protein [Paraburkholderia sp. BR13439]|uniref:mandelate racemase/muconate lactonizing enzyme family protein n=1 Tax=unclassified Paraburkholderia TaxID=2615204 RepID=UPI0034CDEAA1